MEGKRLSKEQALQKLRHYCAYQERCHREAKEKLYSFRLNSAEVEDILAELIQQDYLNEERFARLYAGGKFRMKKWGRVRIRYELKQKQISEYCIRKGLSEIPEQEYLDVLKKLVEEKMENEPDKNAYSVKAELTGYLLRKGFEKELISMVMEEYLQNCKM